MIQSSEKKDGDPMQQINQGLRGIVKEGCGVSDVERLEDIEKIINAQKLNNDPMSIEWPFMSIRENDLRWLVSTVKELSTRLEGAHKYNDAMKLTVEEQQKEIELTKSTWYENYCQQRDMTKHARVENARLQEAVKEIHFQASIVETPDNVYRAIMQALKE